MAKKVIEAKETIVQFQEVTHRASIPYYQLVNGVLVGRNPEHETLFMILDPLLLQLVLPELQLVDNLLEGMINDPIAFVDTLLSYQRSEDWLSLTEDEGFYSGKILNITIEGHEFPILISKDSLPIKLKKVEFVDLEYLVILKPKPLLLLRKKFQLLEEHGFYLLRIFNIV